jgi:K+-sensing histidine kinase KdpD
MSDYKDLEFLAERVRELLDRQISSYRTNHTKAGTIIGISSVFIPVFLFIIEKSPKPIQLLSIIPIAIFLYSIILMINILRSRMLDQGFNQHQFDKLVKEDYETILLYEIGAKKNSITDNQKITEKQNKKFNRGLIATVVAIFISITLLLSNLIINQNTSTMSDKTNQETTQTPNDGESDVSKTTDRVIPDVPKDERMPLNEGYEPKINSSSKEKLND